MARATASAESAGYILCYNTIITISIQDLSSQYTLILLFEKAKKESLKNDKQKNNGLLNSQYIRVFTNLQVIE